MAIATARRTAIVETAVGLFVITVITAFKAHLAGREIDASNPIATARRLTLCCAGVFGDGVAIVTGFLRVLLTITTALNGAVGAATVACLVVAIIAVFKAIASEHEVIAHNAIAAACGLAQVSAGIAVDLVGVITGFHTHLDETIAASRNLAGIGTRVVLGLVAIVAAFRAAKDAVPTTWGCTGCRTVIVFIGVAVIAGFKFVIIVVQVATHDAVATASSLAIVRTCVVLRVVAIIAKLLKGITLTQIKPYKAITAAREFAGAGAGIDIEIIAIIAGFKLC